VVRGRIWFVVLPLLFAGSELAHAVLGRFAPESYQGAELFERSGTGQELLPVLAAVGGALVVAGLATRAVSGNLRAVRRVLAVLPLVVFTIQEHVEYLLGHGHVSWTLVARPAFALGLGLQLPFALAAYVAARLLIGLASAIARRCGSRAVAGRRGVPIPLVPVGVASPKLGRLPGDARFIRGPPRLASR